MIDLVRNSNPNFSAAGTRARMESRQSRKRGTVGHSGARSPDFASLLVGGCLIAAILGWTISPEVSSMVSTSWVTTEERAAIEASVYYSSCHEARTAGVAPIYAGQPGYRDGMDGDGDGIACEPYR